MYLLSKNILKLKSNLYVESVAKLYNNNITVRFLKIIYNEGFILSFRKLSYSNKIAINFAYTSYYQPLRNLKFFWFSLRKTFLSFKDILLFFNTKRLIVLTTTFGLRTLLECRLNNWSGVLLAIC